MEYSSHVLLALVMLNLVLQGHSAPSPRRSRAMSIPEEIETTSIPSDSNSEEKVTPRPRKSRLSPVVEDDETSSVERKPTSRRSKAFSNSEASESVSRASKLQVKFKELTTTTQPPPTNRKNKALNLFGFYPSFLSSGFDFPEDDDDDNVNFTVNDDNFEDDDLSRTIPSKRRQNNKKKNGNGDSYQNDNLNSLQYDNSPIFYIRLPPTPYMFVPGLGYVSQPPNIGPPMSPMMPQGVPPQVGDPFINLPLDFVSNGKPTGVYQWSGGPAYPQVPQMPVDPYGFGPQPMIPPRPTYSIPSYSQPKPKPKPAQTNSKVTNLKGQFMFNGKPGDSVYVLRDTYNSIYSDALQNFYP